MPELDADFSEYARIEPAGGVQTATTFPYPTYLAFRDANRTLVDLFGRAAVSDERRRRRPGRGPVALHGVGQLLPGAGSPGRDELFTTDRVKRQCVQNCWIVPGIVVSQAAPPETGNPPTARSTFVSDDAVIWPGSTPFSSR